MDNIKLGRMNLPPCFMAPMAGVTDKPFRLLVKEYGCGLVFTEMISAKALEYDNHRTWKMLDLDGEYPIGVQLFGGEPKVVAAAAKAAQQAGADLVDINMGCPVTKIVSNGEGAALMRQPVLAQAIVAATVASVSIPVSVKIRSGWDEQNINAVSFARDLVSAGASMLTVHGRTRAQLYSGKANWDIIAEVVAATSVPVIGNGDVWTGQDAYELHRRTKCQGIMVARGALGNPWIFSQIRQAFSGEPLSMPSVQEKIALAQKHFENHLLYRGTQAGLVQMRKHLSWYLKGLPSAAKLRQKIVAASSPEDVRALLQMYLDSSD